MKLCIVTHTVDKGDGQGHVNYEVVWEALRRGYAVTLLASAIAPDLAQHPHVTWVPIPVKGLPTELLRNFSFAYRSAQWLRQHRHEFDLVKVNGAITWEPGDVNAAHFIHHTWLQSPAHPIHQRKDLYGGYQWLYTALNARWEKVAFKRAKQVIAVSRQVSHDLQAIGIPASQIQVVLNGVDVEEFHPGPIDRASLGLPDNAVVAIFVGDIRSTRKNLGVVLNALINVPDLHLAVVGETEGSPYPALVNALSLQQRVHFLGYRRDIPELMRSSDFLVFPSQYETFGLVVLEAMASGIPVIVSEATPTSELVTPDAGVILSDPNDVELLAKEMAYLASHAERRQQMGIQARAIAQQYSWQVMAKTYVDLFEGLQSC